MLVVVIVAVGCSKVTELKKSKFDGYPKPVGIAFDDFFTNTKWENEGDAPDGTSLVRFTGTFSETIPLSVSLVGAVYIAENSPVSMLLYKEKGIVHIQYLGVKISTSGMGAGFAELGIQATKQAMGAGNDSLYDLAGMTRYKPEYSKWVESFIQYVFKDRPPLEERLELKRKESLKTDSLLNSFNKIVDYSKIASVGTEKCQKQRVIEDVYINKSQGIKNGKTPESYRSISSSLIKNIVDGFSARKISNNDELSQLLNSVFGNDLSASGDYVNFENELTEDYISNYVENGCWNIVDSGINFNSEVDKKGKFSILNVGQSYSNKLDSLLNADTFGEGSWKLTEEMRDTGSWTRLFNLDSIGEIPILYVDVLVYKDTIAAISAVSMYDLKVLEKFELVLKSLYGSPNRRIDYQQNIRMDWDGKSKVISIGTGIKRSSESSPWVIDYNIVDRQRSNEYLDAARSRKNATEKNLNETKPDAKQML